MKTLPYFRWYPADAEGDDFYAGLSQEERGVYHTCLNRSWLNNGIPAELNTLAILCRMSRKQFEKVWAKVSTRWIVSPTDSARLVNPRQEIERSLAIQKGDRNKRPGNANASREKRERVSIAFESERVKNANGSQHAQARADSVSDSSFPQKGGMGENEVASMDLWPEFWALFVDAGKGLNDKDKERALKLWVNFDFPTQTKIIAWVKIQLREKWTKEQFTPMPVKVLMNEGWTRMSVVPEVAPTRYFDPRTITG